MAYRRLKTKGVSTSAQNNRRAPPRRWSIQKLQSSASSDAAKRASAEISTGSRMDTRAAAPQSPSTTARVRLGLPPSLLSGTAAAKHAHRSPNSPRNSSLKRSPSIRGSHQGRLARPAMAWTGISTSRASRSQQRKYGSEPRAMVAARNRIAASRTRLDRLAKAFGPIQARISAYQANTAAVSPAQGPCQRKPSTRRRQKPSVRTSRSRYFPMLSPSIPRFWAHLTGPPVGRAFDRSFI